MPASTPYVGLLLVLSFAEIGPFRVLRFSPLLKNWHFQIPIRPGMVDEEPLCGYAASISLYDVIYLIFYLFIREIDH